MEQFRKIINKTLNVLAGVTFIAMVLLTCYQVFTRYILKSPSSWSEELVGYLFAWMSLFGAVLVSGERGHMNIPILVERFGEVAQKALAIFAEVIAIVFAIVILGYGGIQITSLAMAQMTSSLGVPMGVFYIVMPITAVLMVLYSVLNIIDIATGKIQLHTANEAEQALEKAQKEV